MSKKEINVGDRRRNVLSDKTQFSIREGFKAARTNLIFSLAPYDKKIVVVTSAMPSEGKSTACTNLAITMAENNYHVLLIDADMRKPTIHTMFRLKNKSGLSSVLAGMNKDLNNVVHAEVKPKLDVITSGPIPPNPAELLSSKTMKHLLEICSQQYDYIFIDTPPINVVTDSQLMNNIVSGIIFIVKEGSTTHPAIADALQSIKLANGKVLGFLKVNCFSKSTKGYKYSKYGRYGKYGYGKYGYAKYGYGYEEAAEKAAKKATAVKDLSDII